MILFLFKILLLKLFLLFKEKNAMQFEERYSHIKSEGRTYIEEKLKKVIIFYFISIR